MAEPPLFGAPTSGSVGAPVRAARLTIRSVSVDVVVAGCGAGTHKAPGRVSAGGHVVAVIQPVGALVDVGAFPSAARVSVWTLAVVVTRAICTARFEGAAVETTRALVIVGALALDGRETRGAPATGPLVARVAEGPGRTLLGTALTAVGHAVAVLIAGVVRSGALVAAVGHPVTIVVDAVGSALAHIVVVAHPIAVVVGTVSACPVRG